MAQKVEKNRPLVIQCVLEPTLVRKEATSLHADYSWQNPPGGMNANAFIPFFIITFVIKENGMAIYTINCWIEAMKGNMFDEGLINLLSKSYPPVISVTFTRECGLVCKHCIYPNADSADRTLSNLARIEKIISAAQKLDIKDLIHVGRTLKPHHIPILKKFQDSGMNINLIDNGEGASLISEIKKADLFFKGGIDVSIDGNISAHDKQRRPGSYKRAVEASRMFREVANYVSIVGTASAINFAEIIPGMVELESLLPFVRKFQITTASQPHFKRKRISLLTSEMSEIFRQFKELSEYHSLHLAIFRIDDFNPILAELKKYGLPETRFISIRWRLGKSTVEFFPQSIVTAEEFAIDANGRHILPFSLDWHLDKRPEEWEMRDNLILTDPDKSYENLVKKYWKTTGQNVFQKEKEVFKNFF